MTIMVDNTIDNEDKPTVEGIKRYDDTNGYYEDIPCTCNEKCSFCCRGECGCSACINAYMDAIEYD